MGGAACFSCCHSIFQARPRFFLFSRWFWSFCFFILCFLSSLRSVNECRGICCGCGDCVCEPMPNAWASCAVRLLFNALALAHANMNCRCALNASLLSPVGFRLTSVYQVCMEPPPPVCTWKTCCFGVYFTIWSVSFLGWFVCWCVCRVFTGVYFSSSRRPFYFVKLLKNLCRALLFIIFILLPRPFDSLWSESRRKKMTKFMI